MRRGGRSATAKVRSPLLRISLLCALASGLGSCTDTVAVVNLSPPSLVTPADGSTNQSTTPIYSWMPVSGATYYWFMVTTNAAALPRNLDAESCSGCVISGATTVTSFPQPSALSRGTMYYWQVAGRSPTQLGEWSAQQSFTTTNDLVPSITSLSPAGALAGGAALTLSVTGTGFLASSVVRWSGSDRTTTFRSGTQLQASIPASDLTTAGEVDVTVLNPAPRGGTSNAVKFSVSNPVPLITSLSPDRVQAGGAAFTLTVTGTGFVTSSVVRSGGSDRTTTFRSGTQLQAFIPASDIATVRTATVTVFNPARGGGTSNAMTFSVTPPTLPPPSLVAPLDGSINQSTTPVFSWTALSGATSYRIMLATSAAALPRHAEAETCAGCVMYGATTATLFTSSALSPGTTYYWQVAARSATLFGEWSAQRSFTTIAAGLTR
ncbi:MAG: fibronectin type III domain-containing protein [Gemmatimonadetes bacterium]|nr:fibronectin type III domain-containing protein [Gemmatimonadota bacterium]